MIIKMKEIYKFGGNWTTEKLKQVKEYLKAYATIMNKQQFRFAYIDAFAGTGYREVIKDINGEQIPLFQQDEIIEIETYSEGSARIALQITPEFDKYIFIEKSKKHFTELEKRKMNFLIKLKKSCFLMLMLTATSPTFVININGRIIEQ